MQNGDTVLLNRWIEARDPEAFRALCDRYARLPYSAGARILNDPVEAEDVAQECFEGLACLKQPPKGPLGAWLHKTATYRALNRRRSAARRQEREKIFRNSQPEHTEIAWNDIYNYVDEAIAALPDSLRGAVVAHFLEGHTHETIARAEGVSRAAITQRIQRGVDEIRKSLRRRGIAARAATLGAILEANLAEATSIPGSLQFTLGKIAVSGAGGTSTIGIGLLGGAMSAKVIVGVSTVLVVGLFGMLLLPRQEETPRNAVRVSAASVAQRIVAPSKGEREQGIEMNDLSQGVQSQINDLPGAVSAGVSPSQDTLDDRSTLSGVFEALEEIFAAVALHPGDSGDGELDADADGVLDSTETSEVRTVALGSPAWRENLIEHGLDPDAPEYAEQRAMWEPPPTMPGNSLDDAAKEIERIQAKHKVPSGQIKTLARLTSVTEELVFDVYAGSERALAVSELVGVQDELNRPEGFVLLELTRSDAGSYIVEDIDYEDYAGAVETIDRFLEESGGGLLLPE